MDSGERRASDALLRGLQDQFNRHLDEQRQDTKDAIARFDLLLGRVNDSVSASMHNGDLLQGVLSDMRDEKREREKLAGRVAELERARQSDRISRKVAFALIAGAWSALATIGGLIVGIAEMIWHMFKGK